MKISIFGLGYVGAVSAGCLASDGHQVIGVDPNTTKVGLINDGEAPIIEQGLAEKIREGIAAGRLSAITDVQKAVMQTDVSLICVGTPSQLNGNISLTHVRNVCEEIGAVLKSKSTYHVVVARSTMLPGSMRKVVIPILEDLSGKRAGVEFGACINPEFLREGTAIHDYYHPPKTVIGETDQRAGDLLMALYENIPAPLIRTDVDTAEMVKYADNNWHALKVAFTNEIGNICKAVGLDGHKVMNIFCQDTKLNLSPYYMKPGFAFGGSCLPKDVRALTYKARSLDLDLPVLNAILPSNERQISKGIEMIAAHGRKKVGILGFAFKAGTDDLRESPMVTVIETLLGKGYDLRIYDRNVKLALLTGANRDYLLNHIPHISRLMTERMEEVLSFAEVLVVGTTDEEFKTVPDRLKPSQMLVDFVRVAPCRSEPGWYDGICW